MASGDSAIRSAADLGVFATIRRGVSVTPELVSGVWLTLVLAVIAAAGKVTIPIAIQYVLDGVTGDSRTTALDATQLMYATALAVAAIVVSGVCTASLNIRLFRSTEAGLATLRCKAFEHIHRLTILTQNTERKGALVSRVTSDVDAISMFVQWGGILLITSFLQLIAATIVMVWYSWQLTILVWVSFIPFVILLQPAQRAVNRAYTLVRSRMGNMLGVTSEAITGAQTVTAYGIGPRIEGKINEHVHDHKNAAITAAKKVAYSFSAGAFAANFILVVVVIAGAYLGVAGEISLGKLVAFLFLVQLFTGPVQLATEVLNEMQNAVAGWRRVLAILETPIDVKFPSGSNDQQGPAQLDIVGVNYAYPKGPQVLKNISLSFPAGHKVAVVGETGSGKSTLAKLITRFVDPTSGYIAFDGTDIRSLSEHDLRRRVLLVPQEGFLFADTLYANIAYPLRAQETLHDDDIKARVVSALENLQLWSWVENLPNGLDTHVGQRGETLSAGERQLVALARAYVCEADILVMDEVTSAVDPATEAAIAQALDALMRGKTTVTIAHRLSTAQTSDLVAVLDQGEVLECGTHEELLALEGRYASMFAAWIAQTHTA
ncbi:ABC transporter ATP-binding protein [Timonella sp. A28]|uniref:ABC transporter ATP-binding protein n=1 Tax=Timonella sp. A28 TaxID=3442640 RepID=UPI003EB6A77F